MHSNSVQHYRPDTTKNLTHSLRVVHSIYCTSTALIVFSWRVFCFADLGLSRDPSGLFVGCDLDNETLTAVSKTIFPPTYTRTQYRFCSFWTKTWRKSQLACCLSQIDAVNLMRLTLRRTQVNITQLLIHWMEFVFCC